MTDKEIVQALRCCEKEVCADGGLCPLLSDADCIVHLCEAVTDLIERLTAERNAALADLADARNCKTCKYACDTRECSSCKSKTCKCRECHLDKNAWEWRGAGIPGRWLFCADVPIVYQTQVPESKAA